jgi:hypothetical protein
MGEQTRVNSYRGREGSKIIIIKILILTCDLDDCKGVQNGYCDGNIIIINGSSDDNPVM